MGTQKRNYKHGDQKHLHRSIMAITSGPIYLKHRKYFILSIYNTDTVDDYISMYLRTQ